MDRLHLSTVFVAVVDIGGFAGAARKLGVSPPAGGFGLTRLLSYQVADELADGRLRTVLDDCEPPAWPVHLLHREGRHASRKARVPLSGHRAAACPPGAGICASALNRSSEPVSNAAIATTDSTR